MQTVHFKFGKARVPDGPKPMLFLRKWMDEHCRDWRLLEEGDQVAADFVLRKPMPAKKFRSLMAHNVKNWGFKREAYARDNCKPMSIDDYLKGPAGHLNEINMLFHCLHRVYDKAMDRATTILKERAKAQKEAKKTKKAQQKKKAKARQRIRKWFLCAIAL